MHILENISLRPFNTFGIDVRAEYFVRLQNAQEIARIEDIKPGSGIKVLGGGSNILLTQTVPGLVIKNELKGITVVKEDDRHVWISANAGEVWDDLVQYTIARNWGGLENLSLIPGCVGAAPMQNIGAYGVEVKETIEEVMGWHWEEKRYINFSKDECEFGYRDSIFKHSLKGKFLITSVTFRLDKVHCINTSYKALQQQLEMMGVTSPDIRTVAQAVVEVRRSKLPDPAVTGNAGSFFKNPTITRSDFEQLKNDFPLIPGYNVSEEFVKIPAAWLIEQTEWKGVQQGNAAVHEKQPLVLVNKGAACGQEIWELSEAILQSVQKRFGILLEREVNVW